MKKAISAQGTHMYLTDPYAAAYATVNATAGTATAPAVLTVSDVSALKAGDPVTVNDSGWNSLDGQSFVIGAIDTAAKKITLAASDASGETVAFGASAVVTRPAYADMCVASYQINQNPAAQIDTTTLCDDEKTYMVGFPDPGSLTFEFFLNPTDPDYLALAAAYKDGHTRWFVIQYNNGATRTLPVIVQQINETGGVDQAVHGSATLKITGAPIVTLPAGSEPLRLASITASVQTDNSPADGATANSVLFVAHDQKGGVMEGIPLLVMASGTAVPAPTSGTTGASGGLAVSVTDTVAGQVTVTASSGSINRSQVVNFSA